MQADALTALKSLRDAIAADLDVCTSMRDRASLYLRLADTLGRIEDLSPPQTEGDCIEQLVARRRAARKGRAI